MAPREVAPHSREGFLCFGCSDWEALLTFFPVRFRVDEHPEIYHRVPPKAKNHSWYLSLNHLLQWSAFVAVAVMVIYVFKRKRVTSSWSYLSIWTIIIIIIFFKLSGNMFCFFLNLFVLFFKKIIYYLFIFIFSCVGSSLLCEGFL